MKWILILTLWLQVTLFGVVRILTFHYNQSDFIELQHKGLKKFLKDDFELIVFNDAKADHHKKAIEKICFDLGIQCVRYEPKWHTKHPLNHYLQKTLQDPSVEKIWSWHAKTTLDEIAQNPSVRHSHVIDYALEHYGYDHDDIIVIMDGDNFLIKPLSIRELLGRNDIIGFNQLPDEQGLLRKQGEFVAPSHLITPWVVFLAYNPTKLPNPHALKLHVDVVKKQPHLPPNRIGDTGGAIYRYLEKYPHLKVEMYPWQCSSVFRTFFTPQELRACGISPLLTEFMNAISPGNVQFFLHEHFLHFGAVSAQRGDHEKKAAYLHLLIDELVEPPTQLRKKYHEVCKKESDINQHLPVLHQLAKQSSSIVEIGVREMVSSWALLQGLSQSPLPKRSYVGIDIAKPPEESLTLAEKTLHESGIDFQFIQSDDRFVEIEKTDLLFIDSLHTYCHLTYELEKFSPLVTKWIVLHDTSDPWGLSDDNLYQGDYSEYPDEYDRTKRGLWPAVEDFLKRHSDWVLQERRLNNHGLTILRRR